MKPKKNTLQGQNKEVNSGQKKQDLLPPPPEPPSPSHPPTPSLRRNMKTQTDNTKTQKPKPLNT